MRANRPVIGPRRPYLAGWVERRRDSRLHADIARAAEREAAERLAMLAVYAEGARTGFPVPTARGRFGAYGCIARQTLSNPAFSVTVQADIARHLVAWPPVHGLEPVRGVAAEIQLHMRPPRCVGCVPDGAETPSSSAAPSAEGDLAPQRHARPQVDALRTGGLMDLIVSGTEHANIAVRAATRCAFVVGMLLFVLMMLVGGG